MEKDKFYFPHDSNARNDLKIKSLMSVYGVEGYGRYWIVVEQMRESKEYKIKMDKNMIRGLSFDLGNIGFDATSKFLHDCIEDFELFVTDGEYIWSNSLIRRMTPLDNKRQSLKEAGKKGAAARWNKDDEADDEEISETPTEDPTPTADDETPVDPPTPPKASERIPYEQIKELYNSICVNLPKVQLMSDKRKQMIKARIVTLKQINLTFEDYFKYVAASKFLNGQNSNGWTANFDWILNSANAIKILEGNYNDKKKPEESKIENGNIFFNIANVGGLSK